MGFWGIKSYENDLASDAIDAGFDRVHGKVYEDLMDDRNPTPFEKVQERLASGDTLNAALAALGEAVTADEFDEEDDAALAFAGVVVRHVECRVEVSREILERAIQALETEEIEWPRPTERKLRIELEITLLKRQIGEST